MVPSLPDRLRAALKAKGMTQVQLAKRLAVTEARISQVLTGERPVPQRKAEEWASALGLTGKARERFLLEVDLSHASPRLVGLIEDLRRQVGAGKSP